MQSWRVPLALTAQAVVWILAGVCFYYSISTMKSVPRQVAEERLGRPLPREWDRVFINHNVPRHWPYDESDGRVFGAGFLLSVALMGVLEWLLYRMHPRGGWMYRLMTWRSRR